jgi:hypothetical protein
VEHGESRKEAHRLVLDEGTHLSGNFERHFVLVLFSFECDWGVMYARYEMCCSDRGGSNRSWGVLYIYSTEGKLLAKLVESMMSHPVT